MISLVIVLLSAPALLDEKRIERTQILVENSESLSFLLDEKRIESNTFGGKIYFGFDKSAR